MRELSRRNLSDGITPHRWHLPLPMPRGRSRGTRTAQLAAGAALSSLLPPSLPLGGQSAGLTAENRNINIHLSGSSQTRHFR